MSGLALLGLAVSSYCSYRSGPALSIDEPDLTLEDVVPGR
jgi:hypothetical protein